MVMVPLITPLTLWLRQMDDYDNFNYDYEKSLQTKEDEARAVLAS